MFIQYRLIISEFFFEEKIMASDRILVFIEKTQQKTTLKTGFPDFIEKTQQKTTLKTGFPEVQARRKLFAPKE